MPFLHLRDYTVAVKTRAFSRIDINHLKKYDDTAFSDIQLMSANFVSRRVRDITLHIVLSGFSVLNDVG